MSTETRKAIARRWFEEGWAGRLELAPEIFAPHFTSGGKPAGPEKSRQNVLAYRAGFPDLKAVVDRQVAEGDWVTTSFTAQGTHLNAFYGVPATGKPVKGSGVAVWRFEGDQVVESWAVFDDLAVLRDIGALSFSR